MSDTRVFLGKLARRVWFRAALFSLGAVLLALAAGIVGALLPDIPLDLGQGSVGTILQVLATSMLAVTTFSLTAMVTAYGSASTVATPRATQLLVDDPTSQNVLSTFLGGFVFALVGIVALSTGYYGEQGRIILFAGTLVVIALIVVALLRWIGFLGPFGRMADVIDRVEKAAQHTVAEYARHPSLRARVSQTPPRDAHPVHTDRVGYVTHIELARLNAWAQEHGAAVHIIAMPGSIADAATPLAAVSVRPGSVLEDDDHALIAEAFHIARHRDYDQDPRLGMIALSEIASRALSPSTNDPGSAIEVLGALQRVFTVIISTEPDPEIAFPHVSVTPVSLRDLIEDAFRPIARDGAGTVEVGIRLQKTLAALASVCAPDQRAAFRDAASAARRRSDSALSRSDRRSLREAGKR
ncbi:DUF2254 domain-containing protein [Microbacterium sediminicola]|uniref:DUF2254 domain-containing protein n=1 Tax=Microbacterium sediminicola TaxID=415210 RepID=A0ABP4UAS8_9MICO